MEGDKITSVGIGAGVGVAVGAGVGVAVGAGVGVAVGAGVGVAVGAGVGVAVGAGVGVAVGAGVGVAVGAGVGVAVGAGVGVAVGSWEHPARSTARSIAPPPRMPIIVSLGRPAEIIVDLLSMFYTPALPPTSGCSESAQSPLGEMSPHPLPLPLRATECAPARGTLNHPDYRDNQMALYHLYIRLLSGVGHSEASME